MNTKWILLREIPLIGKKGSIIDSGDLKLREQLIQKKYNMKIEFGDFIIPLSQYRDQRIGEILND